MTEVIIDSIEGTLIVGLVLLLFRNRLANERERLRDIVAREVATKSGRHDRIKGFADSISQIKAVVANPNPKHWVVYFRDTSPQLQAGFDSISSDLSPADRLAIRTIVEDLVAFSRINPGDIYENEDKIREKIANLERLIKSV